MRGATVKIISVPTTVQMVADATKTPKLGTIGLAFAEAVKKAAK